MTQSPLEGVGDILPEMPLPPEPPLEDETDSNLANTFNFDGLREFDTHAEALAWALEQRKNGSPKYLVRKAYTIQPPSSKAWEAIQAWIRML